MNKSKLVVSYFIIHFGLGMHCQNTCLFLKKDYLFLERGKGKERERNIMCGCLSHTRCWGPGLQPRHVPWLGIELPLFGSQAGAQSTELPQPGLEQLLLINILSLSSNYTQLLIGCFVFFLKNPPNWLTL